MPLTEPGALRCACLRPSIRMKPNGFRDSPPMGGCTSARTGLVASARTTSGELAEEASGKWVVENAGAGLNTAGDEYEALPSPDGSRMVLNADGGLYESTWTGTTWSTRVKLGPGINVNGSEIGALFSPSGKSLLFSRDTGSPCRASSSSGDAMARSHGHRDARRPPHEWRAITRVTCRRPHGVRRR